MFACLDVGGVGTIVERTCGNKVRFKAVFVDSTVMYPTLKSLGVYCFGLVHPSVLRSSRSKKKGF